MYKGFPSQKEYQKWLGSEISRIYAEIEANHPGIFDEYTAQQSMHWTAGIVRRFK